MTPRNDDIESPGPETGEGADVDDPGQSPLDDPARPVLDDPARPVLDDPDTGDLPAPAATDPGRTTSDSTVLCPFCGESVDLFLEPSGETGRQDFVEECQACSRDFEVSVEYDHAGTPHIHTDRTQ